MAREFPFEVELSLAPLIRFWEGRIAGEDSLRGRLGHLLQTELRGAPELSAPIHDLALLERRRELVEALMAVVFAPAFWEQEYAAALIPFQLKSFYSTPAFERDLRGDDGRLRGRLNVDMPTLARFRLLNAYALVLKRVYGIDFPVDYPLIFSVADPRPGSIATSRSTSTAVSSTSSRRAPFPRSPLRRAPGSRRDARAWRRSRC